MGKWLWAARFGWGVPGGSPRRVGWALRAGVLKQRHVPEPVQSSARGPGRALQDPGGLLAPCFLRRMGGGVARSAAPPPPPVPRRPVSPACPVRLQHSPASHPRPPVFLTPDFRGRLEWLRENQAVNHAASDVVSEIFFELCLE